jgi:hypothetical protein
MKYTNIACCALWGIASGVRICICIESGFEVFDILILSMHVLCCVMYGIMAAQQIPK